MDIPWNTIYNLSLLTYLIYNYSKYWTIDKIKNLENFLTNNKNNSNLSKSDIEILNEIKERSKDGEIIKFFTNKADLQCAITKNSNEKRYTLVFRGTESLWDWIYNLIVFKKKLRDNIYIHRGFYKQLTYNNTFDNIKNNIKKEIHINPDYNWYICGHSLGGALASISSYLLSYEFKYIKWTVITLASPRVGNKHFKESFESIENLKYYRICNNRDIVTAIPTFGYSHVGHNLYFDSYKNIWEDFGYFPKVSYYIYRCWSIKDHKCHTYINNIKKKLE
tara:strand:- start:143 stop:976 length:834 start_codon:yes stop_codon:yes gene_type:complete